MEWLTFRNSQEFQDKKEKLNMKVSAGMVDDAIEEIWRQIHCPKGLSPVKRELWLMNEWKTAQIRASVCVEKEELHMLTTQEIEDYLVFPISSRFDFHAVMASDKVLLVCCARDPKSQETLSLLKSSCHVVCTIFTFENRHYILNDVEIK